MPRLPTPTAIGRAPPVDALQPAGQRRARRGVDVVDARRLADLLHQPQLRQPAAAEQLLHVRDPRVAAHDSSSTSRASTITGPPGARISGLISTVP